ncbi:MAG: N-acetyl sugar amidotransferase [Bacteroidota bacterium]
MVKTSTYQQCTTCVMDTTDSGITFDEAGVCNHCRGFEEMMTQNVFSGKAGEEKIEQMLSDIRATAKRKKSTYDCILGVSGGVDSTYMAYLAHQWGLNPLVIHLDNGWNSEIATQNINRIIDKTEFDLYTHVINWEEFRDLQLSFLKASVVDLELTSDHAIFSLIYKIARKYNISYLLSGFNVVTEGILPKSWRWSKMDWLNIKDIHSKFGTVPLNTFPRISFTKKFYYDQVLKLKSLRPLNYLDYNKEEVKNTIQEYFGWQDYGGKHYESVITRFYQGYILPEKFNIDKRKAHLSTLINSGQINKEMALLELEKPIYDPDLLRVDMDFVLKKFELTKEEFEEIMARPSQPHTAYASYETAHYKYHEQFFNAIRPIRNLFSGNK